MESLSEPHYTIAREAFENVALTIFTNYDLAEVPLERPPAENRGDAPKIDIILSRLRQDGGVPRSYRPRVYRDILRFIEVNYGLMLKDIPEIRGAYKQNMPLSFRGFKFDMEGFLADWGHALKDSDRPTFKEWYDNELESRIQMSSFVQHNCEDITKEMAVLQMMHKFEEVAEVAKEQAEQRAPGQWVAASIRRFSAENMSRYGQGAIKELYDFAQKADQVRDEPEE